MRVLGILPLVLVASLALADRAGAGFGIPCSLGESSPTGFQPCTACAPGTFAPGFGATECSVCPAGTAATVSGSFACSDCDCDDLTACTLDTCNAGTGVCSAEAVPECEVVRVSFAGVVDGATDFPAVTIGMPMTGSYTVDPLAPDDSPLDPAFGRYPSAARSLDVRVGQPVVLEAIAPEGLFSIFDPPSVEDVYLVDFNGIQVTTPPNVPGDFFEVSPRDASRTAFSSDALVAAPPPSSFGVTRLKVVLSVGDDATISATDFTLTTPEPNASALAGSAVTAMIALRVSSRRTT
jgi:hypothetical protein